MQTSGEHDESHGSQSQRQEAVDQDLPTSVAVGKTFRGRVHKLSIYLSFYLLIFLSKRHMCILCLSVSVCVWTLCVFVSICILWLIVFICQVCVLTPDLQWCGPLCKGKNSWQNMTQSSNALGGLACELNFHWLIPILAHQYLQTSNPIGSTYGIYANIWGIVMVNVTIYSIHESYGNVVSNQTSCFAATKSSN